MSLLFLVLFVTLACVAVYALMSARRATEEQRRVRVPVPVRVDEQRCRDVR